MRIKNAAPKVVYPAYYNTENGPYPSKITNPTGNWNGYAYVLNSFYPYVSGYKIDYPVNFFFPQPISSSITPPYNSVYNIAPFYNIDIIHIGFILNFIYYNLPLTNITDSYLTSSGTTVINSYPIRNLNPPNEYTRRLFNLGTGPEIDSLLSNEYYFWDGTPTDSGISAGEFYFSYSRDSYYDTFTNNESTEGIPCWIFERPLRDDLSGRLIVEKGYFISPFLTQTNYKILQIDIYHSGQSLWRSLYGSGIDVLNGQYHNLPELESPDNSNSPASLKYIPGDTNAITKITRNGYTSNNFGDIAYFTPMKIGISMYYDILPLQESFDVAFSAHSKPISDPTWDGRPGLESVPSPFYTITPNPLNLTATLRNIESDLYSNSNFLTVDTKQMFGFRNQYTPLRIQGVSTMPRIFGNPGRWLGRASGEIITDSYEATIVPPGTGVITWQWTPSQTKVWKTFNVVMNTQFVLYPTDSSQNFRFDLDISTTYPGAPFGGSYFVDASFFWNSADYTTSSLDISGVQYNLITVGTPQMYDGSFINEYQNFLVTQGFIDNIDLISLT